MSTYEPTERPTFQVRALVAAGLILALVGVLIIQAKRTPDEVERLREEVGDAREQILMLRGQVQAEAQRANSLEARLERALLRAKAAEEAIAEKSEKTGPPPQPAVKETAKPRDEHAKRDDK